MVACASFAEAAQRGCPVSSDKRPPRQNREQCGLVRRPLLAMDAQSSSRGRRRSPSPWIYVDDVVDAFIAASSRDDLASASPGHRHGRTCHDQGDRRTNRRDSRHGNRARLRSAPGAPTRDRPGGRRRTNERKTSSAGSPERRSPRGCSTVDWYRAELERDGLSVLDPPGRSSRHRAQRLLGSAPSRFVQRL